MCSIRASLILQSFLCLQFLTSMCSSADNLNDLYDSFFQSSGDTEPENLYDSFFGNGEEDPKETEKTQRPKLIAKRDVHDDMLYDSFFEKDDTKAEKLYDSFFGNEVDSVTYANKEVEIIEEKFYQFTTESVSVTESTTQQNLPTKSAEIITASGINSNLDVEAENKLGFINQDHLVVTTNSIQDEDELGSATDWMNNQTLNLATTSKSEVDSEFTTKPIKTDESSFQQIEDYEEEVTTRSIKTTKSLTESSPITQINFVSKFLNQNDTSLLNTPSYARKFEFDSKKIELNKIQTNKLLRSGNPQLRTKNLKDYLSQSVDIFENALKSANF